MPTYIYRCPQCLQQKEIEHSMDEVDNPSKHLDLETTCNQDTCKSFDDPNLSFGISYGTKWKRIFQPINFLSFGSGDSMKGGTLSREEKISRIKKRADSHIDKRESEVRKQSDIDFKKQAKEIIKND